jgi:flagellar hook-length control protein FliK
MQPTGIKSGQLLMEVMAGAQEKIGEDISKSGFSQQLTEQHQLIQNIPFGQPASMTGQAIQAEKSAATSKENPSPPPSGSGSKLSEQHSNTNGTISGPPLSSAPARNLAMNKWRVAQGLVFTDSMALEKVLVQLHLTPSARTEIRSVFDGKGQISLQKLNNTLDRVISGKSDFAPDGKTTADEIQSLLAGMMQQQQFSVQNLTQLGIHIKGSYDFGEFRQLLRRLIDHTATGKCEQSAKSSPQIAPEISPVAGRSTGDAPFASRTRLPNQTQSLIANLIPSFLREEQDRDQNAIDRTTIAPPSVLNGNGVSKISALASDAMDQKKGLFGDQGLKQVIEAVNSMGTNVPSARLASIASFAGGLQRVSPTLISETLLNTLPEGIPDSATQTKTLGTEWFQPTRVAESDLIPATNSNPDFVSIYREGHQQAAAVAPANVADSGEAVIGGLRMNPIQNVLNSDSNFVEGTLSDRPSTPAVERIAAPESTDLTSNQSGSSENRAFSSNDTTMPSNQSTTLTFNTLSEPASPSDVQDRPVEHIDEILRDVIRYRIQSSPAGMKQAKTSLAQSNPLQSQSVGRLEEDVSLGSASRSPLQEGSTPSEHVESSRNGLVVESKATPKLPDDGVRKLETLPQEHTKDQKGVEANRISASPVTGKPSVMVASTNTETGNNSQLPISQEVPPGEARRGLQNSVELLASTEASGEAGPDKSGSVPSKVADQATRPILFETSAKETPIEKTVEKASVATNTSGQFTQHEQSQDGNLLFYKDGIQMTSMAAAPSAQKAPEMLSYYASSLTAELAQKIKELYNQKSFQFTMELQPKHLGRLVVRIGTDAKLVKTSITTESEQAKELLSKSSPLLQQELASQGLVLEELQIDVNSQATGRDQLFQKHSNGSRKNSLSHQSVGADKESTEPSPRRPQTLHADGLISVFV